MIDSFGIHGNFIHYGMVIGLVSSALVIFVYLWTKGRLDMDEEPKYQMMKEEPNDKQ